jgi:imidazolonepropionase
VAETYLLRGARQLLTLRGPSEARRGSGLADLAIINDGAVLIRDGRIEEVGMSRRVENLAAAKRATIIDATGHVVMPAFVDSGVSLVHAHHSVDRNDDRLRNGAPQTACSQREDILEAARALKLVSKKGLTLRAAHLTEAFSRHGTATVGAVSGYGIDDTGEIKTLRTIEALQNLPIDLAPIFFGANAVPDGDLPDPYVQNGLTPLCVVVARRHLAGIAAVRCGPCAFPVDTARAFLLAAKQNGLYPAIYSQQFAPDDSVRFALEMNALSITHLEHIDDPGISLLARSSSIGVLTPAATFHMGLTRFAPARRMIDEGAAVALATAYNPDQCPTYSMPFTVTMACRYLGMSPAEAITASTINAAHAIARGKSTGSIEPGKQADLLILNARDYRELPLAPGVNLVHTMIKSGRIIHHTSGRNDVSRLANALK